jgi:hypothetical protein
MHGVAAVRRSATFFPERGGKKWLAPLFEVLNKSPVNTKQRALKDANGAGQP